MTVMITGGTGFVGSWVARELIDQGAVPILYDARSDMSFLDDVKGKFEFVQGDTLDLANIIQTLKNFGVKRIIPAAALTVPSNPLIGVRVNVEGTINIFEAARFRIGCKYFARPLRRRSKVLSLRMH